MAIAAPRYLHLEWQEVQALTVFMFCIGKIWRCHIFAVILQFESIKHIL